MIKHIKDPLDKRQTVYDFFGIAQDASANDIREIYRYIRKNPHKMAEAKVKLKEITDSAERIYADLFYHWVDD